MKQQLLLLQDVDSLGKKGEVVSARPGYVRNFLLPQGFAMVANANTLKKQERLRKEREAQAIIDRKEAENQAQMLETITLEIKVKVDPEGHMYGSVSAFDVARLLEEKGISVDRRHIQLTKPLKVTGSHKISFKLKEAVSASCLLQIIPEGGPQRVVEEAPLETLSTIEESSSVEE